MSLFTAAPAYSEVIFQDNFEGDTLGAAPSAEIGSWNISLPGSAVVSDTYAGQGSQSLKTIRYLGGGYPSIRGFAASAMFEAGYDIILKTDFYQETFYHTTGFCMHPPDGTGGFEAGWYVGRFSPPNYRYLEATGPGWAYQYVDTGVAALYHQWVTMEIVMHIVESSPGYVTGTYDLYMTPQGGAKTALAENIPLRDILDSDGNIRFGIWPDAPEDQQWGGDVINYWDNITMEKVVTSLCGDEDHPYPYGDLTRDCIVDQADLAVILEDWLSCTFDCD